jgi:phosphoribosylanthranilate isomerase
MIIKICGLRTLEHCLAAAEAGADMLGLNFANSKRHIAPADAAALVAALRQYEAGRRVQVVGLFVNESADAINAISALVGLDLVQLSGDEPAELADALALPTIKALRLDGSAREEGWLGRPLDRPVLVDAHVPGSYGGTGQRADWERAALLARGRPLMLAGGLDPENVAAAVAQVRPWGVDVSSGVERGGAKNVDRIRAFIANARAAAAQLVV